MLTKILGLSGDQMNAAKYAVKYRREGYHLLKNPKGTPSTEVNLIRIMHGTTPDKFRDIVTFIDRRKISFENGRGTLDSRNVSATRFRNPDTGEFDGEKNILFTRYDYKTGIYTEKSSNDLSKTQIKSRRTSDKSIGFPYNECYAGQHKKEEIIDLKPKYAHSGIKDIVSVLSFGLIKSKATSKQNFFKVLWENLHNQKP